MNMASQEQDQDSDFEFSCCITPDSPNSNATKGSPADLLFLNGWLQPHSFPFRPYNDTRIDCSMSTITSRTRSTSSKESFASSRSNSTTSRSSSSSAQTSSSEYTNKKLFDSESVDGKTTIKSTKTPTTKAAKLQAYSSSSQRWQLITSVPVLTPTPESFRRKKGETIVRRSRSKKEVKKSSTVSSTFFQRILRSLLLFCRKCHALESSVTEDEPGGDTKLTVI